MTPSAVLRGAFALAALVALGTLPVAAQPQLVAIELSPPDTIVAAGAVVQFRATGLFSDQSQRDVTTAASWSSTVLRVATVESGLNGGRTTTYADGTTEIRADLSGVRGQALLTVTAACFLKVLYPNGGEDLTEGTSVTIEWDHGPGCGPQVVIELWVPQLELLCPIATTANDGRHAWTVARCEGIIDGYEIWIGDPTTQTSDFSDGPFRILPAGTVNVPPIARAVYALRSLPVLPPGPDRTTPARLGSVFTPIFGAPMSPASWRGLGLEGSSLVPDPAIAPGRGFWLNTLLPPVPGAAVTGAIVEGPSLSLPAGWSIIGAPGASPFPIADLAVEHTELGFLPIEGAVEAGLVGGTLFGYVDTTPDLVNDGSFAGVAADDPAAMLEPWSGRLIRVYEPILLLFTPPAEPGRRAHRMTTREPPRWALAVSASSGASEEEVTVGASEGAEATWDVRDVPLPPFPGPRFHVAIDHGAAAWGHRAGDYLRSISSAALAEHAWPLVVRDAGEEVTLSWTGLESLPPGLHAYFILPGGAGVPLGPGGSFTSPVAGGPFRVELHVTGTPWDGPVVASGYAGVRAVYPNPSRGGAVTVVYQLVGAEPRARLSIHDVRGRLVRNIEDIKNTIGIWEITWDGNLASGRPARPGVYFLRLELGENNHTARVVRTR